MKLRRFRIDGFKALDELDVPMPRDLLFLIGVNGAGKSTILQALSFVRAFASGRTLHFFEERGWVNLDVRPRIGMRSIKHPGTQRVIRVLSSKQLSISLLFELNGSEIVWDFSWSYSIAQLASESIWIRHSNEDLPRRVVHYVRPSRQQPNDAVGQIRIEDLKLEGSLFTVVPVTRFVEGEDQNLVEAMLRWANGITSLELLSPVAMRRGFRGKPSDIGPRGERLAGFIASLPLAKRQDLVARVAQFYPVQSVDTVKKRAGWIDMSVLENYTNIARISPMHMSDGFLRILALCAIPDFDENVSIVLLDEVEDGIEPHILPKIVEFVTGNSNCQFIMTSHSPLLINYFGSDQVCFLTRREDGRAVIANTDEMDLFISGAEFFGVGEIWANASSEMVSASAAKTSNEKQKEIVTSGTDVERVTDFMGAK